MTGEANFDQRVAEAVFRVEAMSKDIADIKNSMNKMVEAIAKMTLLEERQLTSSQAVERAFKAIENNTRQIEAVSARVTSLELAQPLQKQTSDWVNKVLYLVIGAVVSGMVSLVMITKVPSFMERNTMTMTQGK